MDLGAALTSAGAAWDRAHVRTPHRAAAACPPLRAAELAHGRVQCTQARVAASRLGDWGLSLGRDVGVGLGLGFAGAGFALGPGVGAGYTDGGGIGVGGGLRAGLALGPGIRVSPRFPLFIGLVCSSACARMASCVGGAAGKCGVCGALWGARSQVVGPAVGIGCVRVPQRRCCVSLPLPAARASHVRALAGEWLRDRAGNATGWRALCRNGCVACNSAGPRRRARVAHGHRACTSRRRRRRNRALGGPRRRV